MKKIFNFILARPRRGWRHSNLPGIEKAVPQTSKKSEISYMVSQIDVKTTGTEGKVFYFLPGLEKLVARNEKNLAKW